MTLTKLLEKENLSRLPLQQIKEIKQSIQKFFFVNGTNIAFEESYSKKESRDFENKTKVALARQMLHVAEVDKISNIVDRVDKVSNKKILKAVAAIWLNFIDVFDGGSEGIDNYLVWSGNEGGQAALDKMIPPAETFNLTNKKIVKKLTDRTDFLVKSLDKTGIRWTTDIIEEGMENEMEPVEITKFLRDKSVDVAEDRAALITETELITAMVVVELITFDRNGIDRHRWITTLDERVCEICLGNEMAGSISVNDSFPSGHAGPPAHIRCRCYLLPDLPEVINTPVWTGS